MQMHILKTGSGFRFKSNNLNWCRGSSLGFEIQHFHSTYDPSLWCEAMKYSVLWGHFEQARVRCMDLYLPPLPRTWMSRSRPSVARVQSPVLRGAKFTHQSLGVSVHWQCNVSPWCFIHHLHETSYQLLIPNHVCNTAEIYFWTRSRVLRVFCATRFEHIWK